MRLASGTCERRLMCMCCILWCMLWCRWEHLLKQANISPEEAMEHMDELLDVLRFHTEKGGMPTLPTRSMATRGNPRPQSHVFQ